MLLGDVDLITVVEMVMDSYYRAQKRDGCDGGPSDEENLQAERAYV